MSDLLIVSLGPVQDFIAAARRTRDLQAGSDLLTAVARAAASAIQAGGGSLIFPASPEAGAANKIVAIIAAGSAADHVSAAKSAALSILKAEWEAVKRLCGEHVAAEIAEHQLETFLEVFAAAAPLAGDYAKARQTVEALLAGRKALRDFNSYTGFAGREKSPLDPARETVINLLPTAKDGSRIPARLRQGPLWLAGTEYLDTLSLLKRGSRSGQTAEKTPSTAVLAARAASLDDIISKSGLSDHDYEDLVNRLEASDLGIEDLLFRTPAAVAATQDLSGAAKIQREGDKLKPYYAILVADGDHVGKYLDAQTSPEAHRKFSADLAAFAGSARTIVAEHRGHAVYCGGDDVLGLLPYTEAISCAATLAETYASRFTDHGGQRTTLSVGIAIVHIHHPLQRAIALGRAAEAEAKRGRNALSVTLHTRGGTPTTVTECWASAPKTAWAGAQSDMASGVSRGLPYELRDLLREWPAELRTAPEHLNLLRGELMRVVSRKPGVSLSSLPKHGDYAAITQHIERLVISRWMVGAQDTGGEN